MPQAFLTTRNILCINRFCRNSICFQGVEPASFRLGGVGVAPDLNLSPYASNPNDIQPNNSGPVCMNEPIPHRQHNRDLAYTM